MAQPQFGIAGTDSLTHSSRIDVLELIAGINVQQYIRMQRPAKSEQLTEVNAWGITPITGGAIQVWPESVQLTVQEEGVQHEEFNNVQPLASGTGSVGFDANLIFRARASLSVSGKCTTVADPATAAWPSDITAAINPSHTVGQTLHSPAGNPVIQSVSEYTKIRTDWHQFSYEKQWIIAGHVTGANLLKTALQAAHPNVTLIGTKYVITLTYNLSNENFATRGASVEFYPDA